ncbi:ABC transporter permease [Butyrivibrio sp. VCB2001]|uniref:ABC transporter permease n=1 Tax=Butyrivibrio sp. VCB2001 TaxID=1280667 RepID=UPI0004044637|nr:ABC transporter permease [Butyrivibrio sp. VCB2001]
MSFDGLREQILNFIKKKAFILIVSFVLLFIYILMGLVSTHIKNDLPEQQLADRWSDEMNMAQVSIFVTQDQLVKEEDLKKFTYLLEKKLVESGVVGEEDEDADQGKKPQIIDTINIDDMNKEEEEEMSYPQKTPLQELYDIAYCAQGLVNLKFENKTADRASAIGVGGDFFLFHPMTFVAGSYFSGDDLMKDGIVIDEEMAWQLFGSTDIIGECVEIEGIPHYVEGVVKRDKGRIKKAAQQDTSYVYMSYDSLSKYGTILSGVTEEHDVSEDGTTAKSGGITCIEVVCPNPVRGLAAKICKESLGIGDEYVTVVDNTERFSFFSLIAVLRNFFTRSMWNKAIFYPYWENTARGYEDILSLILLVRIICMTVLILILTAFVVDAYRHKKWTVRGIVKYLSDKKYDLEVEHKRKKEKL